MKISPAVCWGFWGREGGWEVGYEVDKEGRDSGGMVGGGVIGMMNEKTLR